MTAAADLVTDVLATLAGDAPLVTLLGGASVFDSPPRDAPWPRVVLAAVETRDWSTATESGAEHDLTLHVWGRGRDRRPTSAIADRLRSVMLSMIGPRAGARIVGVEHRGTRLVARGAETWLATIRFRIVTEPL